MSDNNSSSLPAPERITTPGGLGTLPIPERSGAPPTPGLGALPTPERNATLDVTTDPDFRALLQQHQELTAALKSDFTGGAPAVHIQAIADLTNKLLAKYRDAVTRASLDALVNAQLPPPTPAAGGSGVTLGGVAQEAKKLGGKALLGVSNVLAPLQIPQQLLFHTLTGATQAVKDLRGAGPLWKRIRDGATALATEVYSTPALGLLAAPLATVGLAEPARRVQNVEDFGGILKSWGVKSTTAVKLGGVAGDIIVDPLWFGAAVEGVGTIAKLAGAGSEAERVQKMGRAITGVTTPVGAAKVTRAGIKVTARATKDVPVVGKVAAAADVAAARTTTGVTNFVSDVMNYAPDISGKPGFPLLTKPGKRYSFGELISSEGRNPLKPSSDVLTGGSGAPEAFTRSTAKAKSTVGDYADRLNAGIEATQTAFGKTRANKWINDVLENNHKYSRVPDRLAAFPPGMQDALMSLASETSDNMGALMDPAALEALTKTPLGTARQSATAIAPVVRESFGEEIKTVARGAPPASSNILHMNTARVRKLAQHYGVPEDTSVKAFRDAVTQIITIDTQDGFLKSLYIPHKETLYEGVARAGGSSLDANAAWNNVVKAALNNQDWRATRLLPMTVPETTQAVGSVMPESLGMLDLGTAIGAWRDGHLKRFYALSETPESVTQYLRTLRHGGAVLNTVLDSGMYNDALKAFVKTKGLDARVPGLVRQYVEDISPTIPAERGFVIPQANLLRHLVASGVPRVDAQTSVTHLIHLANPDITKYVNDAAEVVARREGASMRPIGPSTGKASASARTLGLVPTGEQAAKDAESMRVLGRLIDAPTALAESGAATVKNYPTQQFLYDVWKHLSDNGLVFESLDHTPTGGEGYARLVGAPYGPLNDVVVPRVVKRLVDNQLAVGGPQGLAATLNRIRQGVYAGWLANPATTTRNVGGNLMNAFLAGDNPVATLSNWTETALHVQRWGGDFRNIPEYERMGELLQTGLAQTELARGVRISKSLASGITNDTLPAKVREFASGLGYAYKRILERPTRVLGPLESKVPGLRRFGSALGLDAFEYVENIAKLSKYRAVMRATGDAGKAYRSAKTIVFDYANQPQLVQLLRDTGVVAFPGFPAFVAARQVNAMLNHPAALASVDRLGNAVWNAVTINEDQKRRVWSNLRPYMRDGNYIPLSINQSGQRASMYSLGYLLPTSPLQSAEAYTQGFQQGGWWSPLFDIMNAINNQGAASVTAKYGNRVYAPAIHEIPVGPTRATQVLQTAEFLFNSVMPALPRKLFHFGPAGKPPAGLLPYAWNALKPMPGDGLGQHLKTMQELRSTRLSKDTFEEVLSAAVGSVQPVSFGAALSKTVRGTTALDYRVKEMKAQVLKELNAVPLNPDLTAAEKQARIDDLTTEYEKLMLHNVGSISDALGHQNSSSPPLSNP